MYKVLFLLFIAANLYAQDTLKVSVKDIEGALAQRQYQLEKILNGTEKGNVYLLQGEMNILSALKEQYVDSTKTKILPKKGK